VEFSIGKKIIWIIAFTLCNIFIFPIYWRMHVYNRKNETVFEAVLPLLMALICIIWSMPVIENPLANMLNHTFLFFTIVIYIESILKYIVYTWGNKQLHVIKKILWCVCIILLGIITCPIYWSRYVQIKNEND